MCTIFGGVVPFFFPLPAAVGDGVLRLRVAHSLRLSTLRRTDLFFSYTALLIEPP